MPALATVQVVNGRESAGNLFFFCVASSLQGLFRPLSSLDLAAEPAAAEARAPLCGPESPLEGVLM